MREKFDDVSKEAKIIAAVNYLIFRGPYFVNTVLILKIDPVLLMKGGNNDTRWVILYVI